ncbi:response regulator transcription factor [Streptomyces sp. NPDC051956]|uniref:response regulator transcription factor n=1 Tax=Streptomyces sp. NPDC051956 TaxID=3365677 RepID=UPI0037D62C94
MVIHVLVADDSEIVRRGLSDILSSADDIHVVEQAWDGRSAVDAALRPCPDVALLDIRMPGMDGIAATRELQALARRFLRGGHGSPPDDRIEWRSSRPAAGAGVGLAPKGTAKCDTTPSFRG